MKAKLTPKQYAKEGGPRCPVCLSREIEGGDRDMEDGYVYQNCLCQGCKAQWTDVFKLSGYVELERP